jgi:hypothetical protein
MNVMVSYFSFKGPIEKIVKVIEIGSLEKPTKDKYIIRVLYHYTTDSLLTRKFEKYEEV